MTRDEAITLAEKNMYIINGDQYITTLNLRLCLEVVYQHFEAKKCENCAYLDMPHSREPAMPCCTEFFDREGFWITVKLDDYCSRFEAS